MYHRKIFLKLMFLIIFGLVSVSLSNDILTFVGYLMPKPFFWENCSGTILIISLKKILKMINE